MSSRKPAEGGFIDPDFVYTIEGAARALGTTPRTFREQFVNSGEISVARRGMITMVPGWILKEWAERNIACRDENENNGQEN